MVGLHGNGRFDGGDGAMNDGLKTCGKPSRGRYVQGCRCYMCRVANAEYSREQSHRDGGERDTAMVGAEETAEARERVERWRRLGIGLREIEMWTGVNRSALATLVNGHHAHGDGPTSRMSRANHDAIMAAEVKRAPGALVPSRHARNALGKLVDAGWPKLRIAREAGVSYATVNKLAAGAGRCTAKTSDALCRLWRAVSRGGEHIPEPRREVEDWQWADMRLAYQRGTSVNELEEIHHVSRATIARHMEEHGVVFASAGMWSTGGVASANETHRPSGR